MTKNSLELTEPSDVRLLEDEQTVEEDRQPDGDENAEAVEFDVKDFAQFCYALRDAGDPAIAKVDEAFGGVDDRRRPSEPAERRRAKEKAGQHARQ